MNNIITDTLKPTAGDVAWNNTDIQFHAFSGGMKQRGLIVDALLDDPKILVLDEPNAGLDLRERIRPPSHKQKFFTKNTNSVTSTKINCYIK
ncbi:MAG: ATP-binding cassette domain-containing protein [Clostridiaceae bacterium]|nr:ATP-binding cassette domain-containing protein [Clostridiaceae bacterium]